ncbi:MAG TPA: diacylglycerol kinase family protein [Caproiciproducens sp.]|nr:diacylglycerol kinase family protein [Caproiciproducens sp.]
MRFLKSFKYAFRGIVYCINNERNMRIHTVAALYVFAFSFFFTVSRTGYALLCLTVAAVITAEMFNTVAEELSDMAAASFNPVVRIVKDMAAGAVLICALFAVGVGICIFWQPASFLKMFRFFVSNPLMLLLLIAVTALSVVYVLLGPIGIRDWIRKKREN